MSMERRIRRLEDLAGASGESEAEREKRRAEILREAEAANRRRRLEGRGPVFDVDEGGNVSCSAAGRPVTGFHQTLAEEWFQQEREWGGDGLVYDEDTEAFYTPSGELALSRDLVDLQRFMGNARWEHLR